MSDRKATSIRLDAETDRLLAKLSEKMGINRTALIVLAIRRLAASERIKREEPDA